MMEHFTFDPGQIQSDRHTGEEPWMFYIGSCCQNCIDIVEVDFLGSEEANLGRLAIKAE